MVGILPEVERLIMSRKPCAGRWIVATTVCVMAAAALAACSDFEKMNTAQSPYAQPVPEAKDDSAASRWSAASASSAAASYSSQQARKKGK